jgi:hypothetical protein
MYNSNSLLLPKTITQQTQAINHRWPGFVVSVSGRKLTAIGSLKPTSRSLSYKIQITYNLKQHPDIILLNPVLELNFNNESSPHLYPNKTLCLYRPIYGQFKFSDLISETIIPWTSLWLYHYEVWHLTGDWMGGGEHPAL